MSRESLASDIWRACDVMRRDDGTTGIMEYMEQLSWLLFLKAFEDIEDRHEITVRNYKSEYARALDGPYRWSIWTGSRRKRAEQRVEEARQVLNKALANFERVRRRTDALRLDKDQASKDNHVVKADKITDAEQGYLEAQWALDEAEINLQNAEAELQSTVTWLNDQVKILYDEQNVENQVLSLIVRQFGGQINLSEEQINLLRDTERQLGQALAVKLVQGLEGQELLNFVDDRLFPYLRHLSGTPEQNTISSIFREIPGNRMRSANNLRKVITLLGDIHFDNLQDTQIVSQIYEVLLSRLGTEGGIAGEFYTPRSIINFMVQVINPKIGESLFDPFSGSAGFLVEAFKRMSVQELTLKDHETLQRFTFYGQEKKPLPTLLGMMNMILHGVLTPNISRTNTFANEDIRDIPLNHRYDIILTNPPFGASEDPDVQTNFPIQSTSTELLALQYIMAKLQPKGRCGVIVPNGTLSSAVDAYINVKKMLLEKFNLYAIINLPAGVFANLTSSGSGPKTNILFFEGPGPTEQIWYYDIRQVGFTLTKSQNPISENDLLDAADKLQQYRQAQASGLELAVDTFSWIVPVDDLKQRNYDLRSRNPHNGNEDYKQLSLPILLRDIDSKYQQVGEILADLRVWSEGGKVTE